MLPDNVECTEVNEASEISVLGVDKVKFENVKRKYVSDPASPSALTIEYVMDKDVRPSTRDWLGLFPRGWNDLLQNVAFQYIIGRPFNEQERRWKVLMDLKFVKDDLYHPEFQFVFVNSDLQVLGSSSFFRFYKSEVDAERAQKFSVKSGVQLFEKMQISNNEVKPFFQRGNKFARVAEEQGCQERYELVTSPSVLSALNESTLEWYRNLKGSKAKCSNCERLPEILNSQMNLFQEVKNLAEAKRDLEGQLNVLENKLELAIAAQKKLRLVAEFEKKERIAFQSIANSVLKHFSDDKILQVSSGNLETVEQVMCSSPLLGNQFRHPRTGATSSMMSRQLELKAIIGAQNEKLRIMASKIAQMEAAQEGTFKVKTAWIAKPEVLKVTTNKLEAEESFDLNNN